ncbi:hypothetical protein ACC735_39580, partial [Rhizobium ruizarguesonis]
KGDKKVIERLNEALFLELGAVNQYLVHYRLLEDWGYTKLAKKERAEFEEQRLVKPLDELFVAFQCPLSCFPHGIVSSGT